MADRVNIILSHLQQAGGEVSLTKEDTNSKVIARGRKQRFEELDGDLVLKTFDVAAPTGTQVIVKVLYAGVCHSDIHLWEDGWPNGDGTYTHLSDAGMKFPRTPGHEVYGKVYALGPDAENSGLTIGERVCVYPWIACEKCNRCALGLFNHCISRNNPRRSIGFGDPTEGGYSDYCVVASPRFIFPAEDLDPLVATVLPCAGITTYRAVRMTQRSDLPHDGVLAIIGAGGLGSIALQFAKEMTSQKVLMIDIDDDKLKFSKSLGADIVVNSKTTPDILKYLSELNIENHHVEAVIDLVNNQITHAVAQTIISQGGVIVPVGLHGGVVKMHLPGFIARCQTVSGSLVGSISDMEGVMKIARKGILKTNVTEIRPLEDAQRALIDLNRGNITGRLLLQPNKD